MERGRLLIEALDRSEVVATWNSQRELYAYPGPTLQHEMFEGNQALDEGEVVARAELARLSKTRTEC